MFLDIHLGLFSCTVLNGHQYHATTYTLSNLMHSDCAFCSERLLHVFNLPDLDMGKLYFCNKTKASVMSPYGPAHNKAKGYKTHRKLNMMHVT